MDALFAGDFNNINMSMRAWYNILGMELTDREDQVGIKQSEDSFVMLLTDN